MPLSFTTIRSAAARVVDVAEVSPSIIFNSAAVAETVVPAILRASVWLPSMIAVLKPQWITEQGMFWGILIPATIGEILYVSGKLGYTDTAFIGTLIAIFGSPVLTLILSNGGQRKKATA